MILRKSYDRNKYYLVFYADTLKGQKNIKFTFRISGKNAVDTSLKRLMRHGFNIRSAYLTTKFSNQIISNERVL